LGPSQSKFLAKPAVLASWVNNLKVFKNSGFGIEKAKKWSWSCNLVVLLHHWLSVSFRNEAIIPLAIKNTKKIFFFTIGISYFGNVSKLFAKCLCAFVKVSFVSISMCIDIVNVLKPALIFN